MSLIPLLGDPFASAHSEYEPKPIPIPPVPPTVMPVNVPISCYWIPWVAGACKALLQEATWRTTDPVALAAILGQSQDLLTIFEDAMQSASCAGLGVPFACPYDFTFDDGNWVLGPEPTYTPPFTGVWIPGVGWTGTEATTGIECINRAYIFKLLPTPQLITRIEMTYNSVRGTYDTNPSNLTGVFTTLGAGPINSSMLINSHDDPDGSDKVIVWTGSVICDHIFGIVSTEDHNPCGFPGNAVITKMAFDGVGDYVCA
jgi:hypothetical protein